MKINALLLAVVILILSAYQVWDNNTSTSISADGMQLTYPDGTGYWIEF